MKFKLIVYHGIHGVTEESLLRNLIVNYRTRVPYSLISI